MRSTSRLLPVIALALGWTGIGALAAHAGDRDALEVFPSPAKPGTTITVNTTACGKDDHGKKDDRGNDDREKDDREKDDREKDDRGNDDQAKDDREKSDREKDDKAKNDRGKGDRGTGDARSLDAGVFPLRAATHKEVSVGQFTVPDHTDPGTYEIKVRCKNGNKASGDLEVREHSRPSGHVSTGVGGSVGPDTTQIAAGVAVLAASAAGGTLLLRRRASGAQDS
ncbi:hypothetical protein OHS70_25420 [Streptomyces sp. NBC_00390]